VAHARIGLDATVFGEAVGRAPLRLVGRYRLGA